MPRAVLLVLLSWAYAGCAATAIAPEPAVIRVLAGSEQEALDLGRTLEPLSDAERVRVVRAAGTDPGLMLRLGEAEVAVLYGLAAGRLLDEAVRSLRLSRAPGWDLVYFLWMETDRRWVRDPSLRRWLAGVVDRGEMLRFLFDGRGSAAHSLSVPALEAPIRPEHGAPPFGRRTRPRLTLRFARSDPHARSIAVRLRAILDAHGVELGLLPRAQHELLGEPRATDADLALLVHRATSEDATRSLGRTLERLGLDIRGGASGVRETERALLAEARLVPLVRLEAWLARPSRLRGVRAGVYPVLRLERARWRR